MRVKELGEFGLIARISRLLPPPGPDVVVGIGDDVAVLGTSGPQYLLATCDAQVEGVHFTRNALTPFQLGRKAIAINVSDIAAVGGNPLWALVSLALPPETEVDFIDELYRGMREQASLAGASIVGGNLSRSGGAIIVDITLLGQIAPEHLVLRSGARAGDAVLVTGFPGESRAGLELLRRPEISVSEPARKTAVERHLEPRPRLVEGQLLARSGLVRAMVDVSDGLLADLGHICSASGTGAVVEAEKVPVGEAVSEVCAAAGGNVSDWTLSGGEDYELLFAAGAEDVPAIQKMLLDKTGTPCREIGRFTAGPGEVHIEFPDGKQAVAGISGKGWDHFGKDSGI